MWWTHKEKKAGQTTKTREMLASGSPLIFLPRDIRSEIGTVTGKSDLWSVHCRGVTTTTKFSGHHWGGVGWCSG